MFYGWIIFAILCINYIVMTGGTLYTYGTLLVPMAQDLGLTMTEASVVQMAKTIITALQALFVGEVAMKRFQIKTIITFGCLSGVITSVLMVFGARDVKTYWLVYPFFVSLMTSCAGIIPSQVLMTRWFDKKRSTVVSILLAMGGVGGVIFPQISAALISTAGWRSVWALVGILSAVCTVVSLAFLKNSPEEMGLVADGIAAEEGCGSPGRESDYKTKVSFTQRETLLTPFFYVCVLTHTATTNGVLATGNYLVSHLIDKGLDRTVGATAVSIFAFCNIFGRSASGVIQDRVNPRILLKILLPVMALILMLVPSLDTPVKAWVFAMMFGICISIAVPCPTGVLMNTYGVENYGQISALENGMCNVINAALAAVPGVIYDRTGSYNSFFIFVAVYMAGVFVLQMIFKTPKHS